jgi:hypothetical protein
LTTKDFVDTETDSEVDTVWKDKCWMFELLSAFRSDTLFMRPHSEASCSPDMPPHLNLDRDLDLRLISTGTRTWPPFEYKSISGPVSISKFPCIVFEIR